MIVAPSITSGDCSRLAEMAQLIERGGADAIHLDIEDGVFIPTFTVGPRVIPPIREITELPIQVHLQVMHPERWVEPVVEAGADLVVFHPEATRYPFRVIELVRQAGARAGVAVLLGTPISEVMPVVEAVDHVLVMAADPGPADGFHHAALDKVRAIRKQVREIAVDGSVDSTVIPIIEEAGVTTVVAGRAVFQRGLDDVAASIAALRGGGDQ